jgi:FMN-dependent oxidoreductase (nitrilotriacetate monooxygenase family)
MTQRQMSIGFLMDTTGVHPASWIHPDTQADAALDIGYYTRLAQMAEAAKLDMVFRADTPAARTRHLQAWSRYPMFMNLLEPLTLLSALAGATTHIGLGGTATTSFNEPYNVARQFASLDHISAGRAGWNVVTSANEYVAQNFGLPELPPHAERYARAREFVQVVTALWNSWEDGAFVRDRETAMFFDPAAQHAVHHDGAHFRVDGALNIERTPQGRPVIIQAGQSGDGRAFAAETAEVIFASANTLAKAQAFYSDMHSRLNAVGRAPDSLKVLPGLSLVLGESVDEAEEKYQVMQRLLHPEVSRQFLAGDLEADLSDLPLDEPIPLDRIPTSSNLHQVFFAGIVEMIRTERPTLRELATRYTRGRNTFRGTPMQAADMMQEWFEQGGADGFMLSCQTLPTGLADFTRLVVPELQRRGVFRREYSGTTLREHLGLARPCHPAQEMAA